MKKSLLICLLLCMGVGARAQQFFNVRNTLHSFSSTITSVIPLNGKYYCTGVCWDSVNCNMNCDSALSIWGVKFAIFDSTGQKLRDTVYQEFYRPNIITEHATTKLLPDSTLLVAAFDTDTSQFRLLLLRFDTLGNRLGRWEYDKPLMCQNAWAEFWNLVDFKPCENHGWLLLSTIVCGDSTYADNSTLLTKLDSNFNVLWQKEYGNLAYNNVAGALLVEPDGSGYVLGGDFNDQNYSSNTLLQQSQLIKVDTGGNQLWLWQSDPTKITGGIKDLVRTKDGGYLYSGVGAGWVFYHLLNDSYWDIAYYGWVEKLDANRNIVWNKTIGTGNNDNLYCAQQRILELPDSSLVVAGETVGSFDPTDTNVFTSRGTLVRLKANGDYMWHRTYIYQNDSLIHYFYDLRTTDDGGYIMGGEANDEFADPPIIGAPIQRGWLVKVDSAGCLGPNDPQCQDLNAVHPTLIKNKSRLYPNPASSNLELEYVSNNKGRLDFVLSDATGRAILSQHLAGTYGHQSFSVGHLAPGLYIYQLMENGLMVQQGKVVKQ